MEEEIHFEIIKKGFGYKILTFLYNNRNKKSIYGGMIAKNFPIAEANISSTLKKLEYMELIVREVSPKSKRTKYITLTDEGVKLTEFLIQIDIIINRQKQKNEKRYK